MSDAPHVVCLGGGYVAIYLVKALRKAIKQGKIKVTIVDRNNYHTFHGLIAEMLVGKLQPGQIISPARRLFLPANFHNAKVIKIDIDNNKVLTHRKLDGREYELSYDHLVVSLGSIDNLSLIAGVAEHSFRLKTYWDCFRIRNHLLHMLELAEIEPDPEERRRLLTYVIAGGNYAGIEVATELADFLPTLVKKAYPRLNPEEIRIALIHSGDTILPELGERFPRLLRYARRFIDSLGLDMHLKNRLESATAEEALLSDGTRIPTRTIISCVGSAQSPLLDDLPYERDPRGRLITDPFVRIPGTQNIWSGGDCAAVPDPNGGYCPSLAIYAMTSGRQIGRNILRVIEGRAPESYRFTGLGDAVSFGHRRAAGHLKGIQLTGLPAWLVWRIFMFAYLPTWDRRVRALLDWLVWPFFGRDIVSLQTEHGLELREALYEPGQEIVTQGEVGDTLYVIRSGEVDVLRQSPGGETLVGTLGEGQHFGEIAVFESARRTATVRAKTRVKLLTIRREAAEMLSDTLDSFDESVRRQSKAVSAPDELQT